MEIVLLKQICIMFLLIAVGMLLVKTEFLGSVLLRAVIPCVVIKSYITEYSHERLFEQAESMFLTILALAIAMAVSYLVFGTRRRIEDVAAAFSNVGFIGIPLIQSVLGDGAIFYLTPLIAVLNILQWTYGVYIMTGDRKSIQVKTILTNFAGRRASPVYFTDPCSVGGDGGAEPYGVHEYAVGHDHSWNLCRSDELAGASFDRKRLCLRPGAPGADPGGNIGGFLPDPGNQDGYQAGDPDRVLYAGGLQYRDLRQAVRRRL